jgi:ABC-type multidrug transport system ATPase subunit
MIRVDDVSHHYGVNPVLSHVSFEVRSGELVVVMGPNGAGKSTLLSVVAGLMSPAKGCVEINGLRRRASENTELQIRRQLAFLPDQTWLPEFKTGREWLMAVGELYDTDIDRLMDHISRVLELFQLAGRGEAPIRTYSNGQKKKLAICAVLVTEAPILVLDEPFTGGLDPAAILALGRVLKHLADQENRTILMASQIAEMIEPLAHRIAILEGAHLKAYDTLDGLRAKTGCAGSFPEVFEKLVHPQTLEQIDNYFNRPRA